MHGPGDDREPATSHAGQPDQDDERRGDRENEEDLPADPFPFQSRYHSDANNRYELEQESADQQGLSHPAQIGPILEHGHDDPHRRRDQDEQQHRNLARSDEADRSHEAKSDEREDDNQDQQYGAGDQRMSQRDPGYVPTATRGLT